MPDEPRGPRHSARTVDDAFDGLEELRDLLHRAMGFREDNYEGGKLGEIKRDVSQLSRTVNELFAKLPEMIATAISNNVTTGQARRYTAWQKGLLTLILAPFIVGLLILMVGVGVYFLEHAGH